MRCAHKPSTYLMASAVAALFSYSGPAYSHSMPRMSRGLFLANTSYGSLAWVHRATTTNKRAAQSKEFVKDISHGTCFSLPPRSIYWFLINHRNVEDANSEGFFVVRVVARRKNDTAQNNENEANTWLSLYRNPEWVSYSGKPLPDEAHRGNPQLKLSIDQFTALNDDLKSQEKPDDVRRKAIDNALGASWHAVADAGSLGTWAYRDVFASRNHIDPESGSWVQLSARLIQFIRTGKDNSPKTVVFSVYRNGASRFWIDIEGPGIPFKIEKEFRVNAACGAN